MAELDLVGSINIMKSFKTLETSRRTLRAINPSKTSQFALLALARPLHLPSRVLMAAQSPPKEYHDEYHWIEEAESLEKYRRGGYHPVVIGDMLKERYKIVDKLGYGGYSTVWLARDVQEKQYVALKIGISDSRLQETSVLRSLTNLKSRIPSGLVASLGHDVVPPILDEFTVCGPNGTHPCYTTSPAQCNLRDASFHHMFSLEVARALSVKLASAIAYVHSQGYIHGDIHLGNAMLKLPSNLNNLSIEQLHDKYGHPETVAISRVDGGPLPPNVPEKAVLPLHLGQKANEISLADTHIILADFGEAFAPASTVRPCKDSRSPLAARPPEARFEPLSPLSFSSDIWCLAVAIWNLVGMKPIFSDEFVTPDSVLAQQVDVLGPMPPSWWQRWEQRRQFFDEGGNSIQGDDASPPLGEAFDAWVQKYRKKHNVGVFSEGEKTAFLHLLRRMLSFDPQNRPTALDVLKSEWVMKWAKPALERSMEEAESDLSDV